ncbi:hypothetical protein FACS189483_09020 [Spirochaetia bacterium]|nr:hypothetical protein FACS189483_09020 [Spirochaetia bacterium]
MSAVIIPFPDEEARELLLNGFYRPQDLRAGPLLLISCGHG